MQALPDPVTLKQYFEDPNNSQSDLARDMDVTPGAVWQWANHETKPRFERCKHIFRCTHGKVTGEEWYPEEKAYFATLTLDDPASNDSDSQSVAAA